MISPDLIQALAVMAIPLLFAITLHEVAHGWVASLCGDQSARMLGRLTINPIKHIDIIGTIIVPIVTMLTAGLVFGWAKPVPVNPKGLRSPRRDMALVALAGPGANLLMAVAWGLIGKLGLIAEGMGNVWLGVPLYYMGEYGIMINVVLGVLNLIPLPPLDGGKVLASLLPPKTAYYFSRIEGYGFIILVVLIVSGILFNIIGPAVMSIVRLISALCGLT